MRPDLTPDPNLSKDGDDPCASARKRERIGPTVLLVEGRTKEIAMTSRATRRTPRIVTAALATSAVALAAAAPGFAMPAGEGAAQSAAAAHDRSAQKDLRSAARTGSLAGTTEAGLRDSNATATKAAPAAPGNDGATTLAVVLIAAGALAAGASAGFAGGRRAVLRVN
jgi:hypothetical protein